jgi:hypothetical protein
MARFFGRGEGSIARVREPEPTPTRRHRAPLRVRLSALLLSGSLTATGASLLAACSSAGAESPGAAKSPVATGSARPGGGHRAGGETPAPKKTSASDNSATPDFSRPRFFQGSGCDGKNLLSQPGVVAKLFTRFGLGANVTQPCELPPASGPKGLQVVNNAYAGGELWQGTDKWGGAVSLTDGVVASNIPGEEPLAVDGRTARANFCAGSSGCLINGFVSLGLPNWPKDEYAQVVVNAPDLSKSQLEAFASAAMARLVSGLYYPKSS